MNLAELDNNFSSTDEEINGTPVAVGGTTFLLKPMSEGNRGFMVLVAGLPSREDATNDSMMKLLGERLPEVLATALVAGWSGMTAAGEDVPYSAETALEVFTPASKVGIQGVRGMRQNGSRG